ncbi:MAG TPA: hypothetical protein VMB19_01555 [Silvibacterium sp.]|nr:hypothetical protein [Silvibacterium sp.]
MKEQRPVLSFAFLLCVSGLLLATVVGCQKPVSAVVVLTDPPSHDQPSIYVEKGGTVQFEAEVPDIGAFTVSAPDGVCEEGNSIQSTERAKHHGDQFTVQVATCHVILAQAQHIEFNVYSSVEKNKPTGKPTGPPIQTIKAYVRPCPPACK